MGSSQFEFINDLDERYTKREKIIEGFKQRIINDYIAAVKEFNKDQEVIKIDSLIKEGLRILIEEFR